MSNIVCSITGTRGYSYTLKYLLSGRSFRRFRRHRWNRWITPISVTVENMERNHISLRPTLYIFPPLRLKIASNPIAEEGRYAPGSRNLLEDHAFLMVTLLSLPVPQLHKEFTSGGYFTKLFPCCCHWSFDVRLVGCWIITFLCAVVMTVGMT